MTILIKALSLGLGLTLLGACQYEDKYRAEQMSPSFGNAMAHNSALQIADPWPRAAADNNLKVPAAKYGGETTEAKGPQSPKLTQSQRSQE